MTEGALVDRTKIALRGKRLEYLTLAWNTVEGLVAVGLGAIAGSIALVGFGLDSFIELVSGTALLWRMSVDADALHRERNERRALRIVGLCFLFLAAYMAYESGSDLLFRRAPQHSVPGVLLACVSLVAMPLLSRAKRKVGHELRSVAMEADAKQSEFCAYLSGILLFGLLMNVLFDFWWADPVAALLMVPIIAREGVAALRGRGCADCRPSQLF
jgi:divalent metal cation (Fe/Co/Zn/Cd) transporter